MSVTPQTVCLSKSMIYKHKKTSSFLSSASQKLLNKLKSLSSKSLNHSLGGAYAFKLHEQHSNYISSIASFLTPQAFLHKQSPNGPLRQPSTLAMAFFLYYRPFFCL